MKRPMLAVVALLSFLICFFAARQNATPAQTSRAQVRPASPRLSAVPAGAAIVWKLLEELEQGLALSLQPNRGTWSGERLAELCLAVKNREPLGFDAVRLYADGWARADPAGMYRWFAARGSFTLPASGGFGFGFESTGLSEWAQKDPEAALAAAAAHSENKGAALAAVISGLLRTDPVRARQTAEQHLAVLAQNSVDWFGLRTPGVWEMFCQLPNGSDRGKLMASWLRQRVDNEELTAEQMKQHWQNAPEDVKRDLAAADFVLTEKDGWKETASSNSGEMPAPKEPILRSVSLDGLEEMARAHVEQSSAPDAAARFLAAHGQTWAAREPAAAVQWSLTHLRGRERVNESVTLFRHAAVNFDAALAAWQTLPDGMLKARAAGALAAGAPESHSAAVAQLMESLPPADRKVAEAQRRDR